MRARMTPQFSQVRRGSSIYLEDELRRYEVTESMVRYLPRYEDGVGMDPWSFIRSYEEEIERIPAEGFTKDQLCRKLFSFAHGYEPRRWIARL